MVFKKFPKININNIKQATKCRGLSNTWVKQEKIHVSHFMVIIGAEEIKFGSKKKVLPPIGEPTDYFDYSEIADELTEYGSALRKELGDNVNVHGELFGQGKKIQPEIFYSDKLQ